jgi:hypothetical protein
MRFTGKVVSEPKHNRFRAFGSKTRKDRHCPSNDLTGEERQAVCGIAAADKLNVFALP